MAFVVRRPQSNLNEAQVMDFIAKQVISTSELRWSLIMTILSHFPCDSFIYSILGQTHYPIQEPLISY